MLTVDRARDRWSEGGEPIPPDIRIRRTMELDLHGVVEFLHGATAGSRVFSESTSRETTFASTSAFPTPR